MNFTKKLSRLDLKWIGGALLTNRIVNATKLAREHVRVNNANNLGHLPQCSECHL
jgi:hypothetical protein